MSADRVLAEAAPKSAPALSPEVRAERKRVMDALGVVIDDCLREWESTAHKCAEDVVKGLALELVSFSRFVRRGESVEEFRARRVLPIAEEIPEETDAEKAS